jgi:hypothetical protein
MRSRYMIQVRQAAIPMLALAGLLAWNRSRPGLLDSACAWPGSA